MQKAAAPSRPTSKHRDVLDALMDLVAERRLKAGDRLPPEVELAAQLGVGRSTVREVLKSWQSMGIVTRNKGGGTRLVAPLTERAVHLPLAVTLEAESLLRTLEIRRPLEIEAVRLSAVRATPRQRKHIEARLLTLLGAYQAGEDWRAADQAFHAAIHDASGNPLFGGVVKQLQRAFDEVYEAPFGRPHLGSDTIPRHRNLADAVLAGDADGAATTMAGILDEVENEVRAVLESQDNG